MNKPKLWLPVIGVALIIGFGVGCRAVTPSSQEPTVIAAPESSIPEPSTVTPLPATSTLTPLPPSITPTTPPTPTPLPCETHTAAVALAASASTIRVGQIVTITVTLHNQGCSPLGLPQYVLTLPPSIFDPGNPEYITHYRALEPGQTDTAEFVLRAVEAGQGEITANASFEVHLGYPGPAYWAGSNAQKPLVVNVMPLTQPTPTPASSPNQRDLGSLPIRGWAWSPDGQTIALTDDQAVYFYDLAAPAAPPRLEFTTADPIRSLAFSPDSRLLAVGSASGAIQVRDVEQRNPIFTLDDDPRMGDVNTLAFSPDGRFLAAGGNNTRVSSSADGLVRVLDLNAHPTIATFEPYGWVGQLVFSLDGANLAVQSSTTCGRGGSLVYLQNLNTGETRRFESPRLPTGEEVSAAFSPDGRLLALGIAEGARCITDGGAVDIWDLTTGEQVGVLSRYEEGVSGLAFSRDGLLLATSDGNTIRLWNIQTMVEVMSLSPQVGPLKLVGFNPDSTLLAYLDDNTLQLKSLPPDLADQPDSSVRPPLLTVEEFGASTDEQLRATYSINDAGGLNWGAVRLVRRADLPIMALDYTINQPINIGQSDPGNNYVLAERCFTPEQDWRHARYLELWVENDEHPKNLVVQFGEGRRCANEAFGGEVWRLFVYLPPGEKKLVNVRLDGRDGALQRADWSPQQNNQVDWDRIGYFAVGVHSVIVNVGDAGDTGVHSGVIYLGPVRLWP